MVQSPGRCSHRCGRVTLQGKVIWARAREKGYHLKFYLHFISPLLPHYWCRVAALLSQTSRDQRCGRVTWQVLPPCWSSRLAGAHERNAFGPPLWSSCQAGTRKAEGSVALPLGADPGTEQRRAPTQEPALLVPVAPGCFPWFFSGWMTRAPSQAPALSGTPLRTTLLSFTCCFILLIWVSELKVGGDGLRPLAQTNLL